ncbi:MAG: TIM-barrel domain-containing protein [Steroidobacteraceae bacterium]
MRIHFIPAPSVAKWLLIGIGPVLLASCAKPSAPTIRSENARFEFLTASLVRMEYSPSAAFVDSPTAVVQKRDWPAVQVHSMQKDGWLIATTGAMTLRYRMRSGPFSATNLEITWSDPTSGTHSWHPGDVDPQNLGGLTYSLDNVSKDNLPESRTDLQSPVNDLIPGIDVLLGEAKPGLLSRNGYAFIDDSQTPVWNSQRTWIEPRSQRTGQDWYLFTYNRDYRKVLNEYAQLCGPVPMIPRYVLGPWITDFNFEYFPGTPASDQPEFKRYNQQYLEEEVSRLRTSHIPFDVLVLDFAWHNYGWDGGYDWSPLIPQPDQLSSWLHGQGIKLSLNDHPGYANTEESIVSFDDSHAPAVLKALGRPLPAKPSFDLDISKLWRSSTGTDGTIWYRASVQLPAKLPDALYLYLGEVKKSYQISINGREATHSQAHWPQRLTYTDLTPYVKAGGQNEIVLRVEPGADGHATLLGPMAIRNVEPPKRIYFDLSNQEQADISMRELHKPLMQQGVDIWWVDGGSGAVDMPGLNKQLWTNKVFYDYSQHETGKRGFILGRYGDWGSERYPAFFTGDTYSQWPVLAYEVAYTARGGNVLVPYISHDIGGFHGAKIDYDLYARWIEFGTFSPILRMHSAHANPLEGNMRLPWVYGDEGVALMKKYFALRTQLIPYLYTYTWQAHKESTPILRPLYLHYPNLEEAYRHSREYFFGDEMLVAPVLAANGDQAIYLPPGQWMDFFTGKHHSGGSTFTAHYAVDETPVFVREGAIIPEQPVSDYSDQKPLDTLILDVYGSGNGRFQLYEDDGVSLAYNESQYSLTTMTHATSNDGLHHLVIEPAKGTFQGQVPARSYELRIHTADRPSSLTVNGSDVGPIHWDAQQGIAVVALPKQAIRNRITVAWRS